MSNFFMLLLVMAAFSFQQCNEPAEVKPPSPPYVIDTTTTDTTYTYLALGDSYTIGESVAEAERYPNQLADSLFILARTKITPVDIVARTGWTTAELQAGIAAREDLLPTYDLVSLLIGVNNQFRGYDIDEYEIEFRELLEQAITFANNRPERVFVISIPDYAYTPYGSGSASISAGIDDFNAVNQAITAEYGINYFNITLISREGLNQPDLVASDGLHPSGKQYGRWVNSFWPAVAQMLP